VHFFKEILEFPKGRWDANSMSRKVHTRTWSRNHGCKP